MLCAFRDLLSHRSIRRTPFKCRELIRQYPPHFLVNGKLRLTGNDLCLDKHKRKFSANTAAVLAKRLDLDIQFLAEFACKAFKRSFPQLCFSAGKFPQMRAGALCTAADQLRLPRGHTEIRRLPRRRILWGHSPVRTAQGTAVLRE